MKLYNGIFLDRLGSAIPSATVRVVASGTDSNASLFDANGSSISNPITTDSDGRFSFQINDGVYDFKNSEDQVVQSKVQIFDESTLFATILAKLTELSFKVESVDLTTNGHLYLENGLKIKWGNSTLTGAPSDGNPFDHVVTYPTAFATSPWVVYGTVVRAAGSAGDDIALVHLRAFNESTATFVLSFESGAGGVFFINWLAIGT